METNGGVSYREALDMPLFELNLLIAEIERINKKSQPRRGRRR